jgi:hypothetical protein
MRSFKFRKHRKRKKIETDKKNSRYQLALIIIKLLYLIWEIYVFFNRR